MKTTAQELKEELKKSRQLLKSLRDEIRVRIHLAGMDARDAFADLDAKGETALREGGEAARAVLAEVNEKLQQLAAGLRKSTHAGPPNDAQPPR